MRLIDANKLKASMYETFYNQYTKYHDSDQVALYELFIDGIDESEPVDYIPVIHSKWENGYTLVICQNCGGFNNQITNYCPHCGAKMDLN